MTDLCVTCVHQAVCSYKNDFRKLIESTPRSLWETNDEENTHPYALKLTPQCKEYRFTASVPGIRGLEKDEADPKDLDPYY